MALSPPLGHGFPSEPLSHTLGVPRELDAAGCTIYPVPGEKASRPELAQTSLGPPERVMGELKSTEPTTSPPRLPLASHEHQDGGKPCEPSTSGLEVLEAEQDSLQLCLLRLNFRLQDLEQGLRSWTLAHSRIVQLQVLEKANLLDQDLEVEGDPDGPAPGGIWGSWASSAFPTPAELEWDPAGDVGGLGPSGQKISRMPGAPCELCGYRGPQSSGQGLKDLLSLGLSHRKHLAAHHRRRLRKAQDKKRQASPSLPDVMLEVDHRVPAPASRWPLTLFFLLLFFLLVGATLLLPLSGIPCCSHARLVRTPYLVLSYVNGLPPI
ncbi:nesprin-4 isoform X2 [Psammomys obesus]|uniref:nesprin-4 isoform X2 n=1 Tax=Psammomys obesus TaxID=48139 RepID=UPI002452952B|nr:nesprin-4 isoform X2 [Psammomys obesus]